MTVRIVTDSSSNISPDMVGDLPLEVLDLHVVANGKERSTAGLSSLELVAAYARQLERGHDAGVLAIHLSKELSSMWSNAVTAAGIFGTSVCVMDTNSVGFNLGFAALAAARKAATGADLATCRATASNVLSRCHLFLYVHRIDELRRSGRMSTAASLMSTALAFRPIVELRHGRFELAAKTRTFSKAMARLIEAAVDIADGMPVTVCVQHHEALESAEQLASRLLALLPETSDVQVIAMSPVLAVHSGPGAVAMSILEHEKAGHDDGTVGPTNEARSSADKPATAKRNSLAGDLFGLLKNEQN